MGCNLKICYDHPFKYCSSLLNSRATGLTLRCGLRDKQFYEIGYSVGSISLAPSFWLIIETKYMFIMLQGVSVARKRA